MNYLGIFSGDRGWTCDEIRPFAQFSKRYWGETKKEILEPFLYLLRAMYV
jgi:hypothetical protein